MAVGSAVALGLFLVALDYGEEAGPLWTVAVVRTVAWIALALAAVASRPTVRARGRALPILVGVGLLIATANVSFASSRNVSRRTRRLAGPYAARRASSAPLAPCVCPLRNGSTVGTSAADANTS